MNLALLFLFLLQSPAPHSVTLDWPPFVMQASCYGQCTPVGSTPTNPGWYNVYRAPQNADGSVGAFAWIGHVQQISLLGVPAVSEYIDSSVVAGTSYSYEITFIQTPSGTPIAVETEPSEVVKVSVPSP